MATRAPAEPPQFGPINATVPTTAAGDVKPPYKRLSAVQGRVVESLLVTLFPVALTATPPRGLMRFALRVAGMRVIGLNPPVIIIKAGLRLTP